MDINEKTIVITGGASGIGRALAVECGRRGASVAVADMNEVGLAETQLLFEEEKLSQAKCSVHQLDVSSLEGWRQFKEEVEQQHDNVDGVINNAGIAFFGSVEDMSYEDIDKVMAINFHGMVYGSKEFLPELRQRPEAFIANVSSIFGLFPMKQHAAYCASKYAIRGFTEVLAQELRGTNVLAASIHPGHIGTDISRNAITGGNVLAHTGTEEEQVTRAEQFKQAGLPPAEAAQIILDNLRDKQRRILVGQDAAEGDRLSRTSPIDFVDSANDAVHQR